MYTAQACSQSRRLSQMKAIPKKDKQQCSIAVFEAAIKDICKKANQTMKEITVLDFTGFQIGQLNHEIKICLEKCTKVESLTLAECQLTSLECLPLLSNLLELDVSSNALEDSTVKIIPKLYPKLKRLNIADNKIRKIETLKMLAQMKTLEELESQDNPMESSDQYSGETVFEWMPNLKVFDNKNRQGEDVFDHMQDEDEDEDDFDEQEQDDEGVEGDVDQQIRNQSDEKQQLEESEEEQYDAEIDEEDDQQEEKPSRKVRK